MLESVGVLDEERRGEYLDELTENGLSRLVSYVNTDGKSWEYSLAHMLQHLVNHSTYYRGQVATLLRQLRVTQNPADFLWYVDGI